MSVCLMLIQDGRKECLRRCFESVNDHIGIDQFDQFIEVDDSAHELGFAGAIQKGWDQVETDYIVHLEQDFVFLRDVSVIDMTELLERRPALAQISLKRQPWNAKEKTAGGIVEANPNDFLEIHDDKFGYLTIHGKYFTTNPSVYRSSLCEMGWPQSPQSEGLFTEKLLLIPGLHFAIAGSKFGPPWVEHIGEERKGHGY